MDRAKPQVLHKSVISKQSDLLLISANICFHPKKVPVVNHSSEAPIFSFQRLQRWKAPDDTAQIPIQRLSSLLADCLPERVYLDLFWLRRARSSFSRKPLLNSWWLDTAIRIFRKILREILTLGITDRQFLELLLSYLIVDGIGCKARAS